MKKSLLTLLGAGLLLTSCQSDEPFAPVEGGEKQVTFTLNVPGELGTRAGEAYNSGVGGASNVGAANIKYTLVLDANGDTQILTNATTISNNGRTATFTPTVVLGREYTITAYASFDDNSKINEKEDIEAIEVSKNFNDESKDAYFKTLKHNFAKDDLKPLTLTRPYGKLRLVATDYKATGNGNTAIKSVKVKYNNKVFTTFNAVNGKFSGEKSYEYTLNETNNYSTSYYAPEKDENDNVTGQTIFADYIPVNETGVAPFTITVEYTNGEKYTRTFAEDIPVKRNALTTLKGAFFTAGAQITVKVDDNFENETVIEDIITVKTAAELTHAIATATDNTVIYFADDITGDVVATQKPDVKVTILGQGYKFNGMLTVDGKSATYTTAGLTIKNVEFVAQSISGDACIRLGDGTNDTRYTCNVTVDNCTFDVPGAVGVKSYTGGDKNLTITGCTATANAHSLVQAKGIDGILIENCIVNSKNGLNFNNSTNVIVDECTADVKGYAARLGESSGGVGAAEVYSIKNSTLKSANEDGDAVIILRGTADNSTLTIENTTIVGEPQIANTATNATIIIDGVPTVYSAQALANVVAKGYTNINLADGEYNVYGCGGKTLTLNGSENAIIKLYNDGEDGCDYAFGGNGTGVGNVTFNGLTINTTSNTGNYKGFAYMKGTFNDCKFEGAYSLNNANDFVFNRCTFDFKNGYFWTWGANSVTFDGCTFKGNSKNILAHGYASTVINIKNCTFAATEKGFTGAGDNTAVVEIDPAGTNTYKINFTGTNTKTEFYNGWTRVKDGSTGHVITGLE